MCLLLAVRLLSKFEKKIYSASRPTITFTHIPDLLFGLFMLSEDATFFQVVSTKKLVYWKAVLVDKLVDGVKVD